MGMTFQAFRGSSGAQIAFTILLATSIGDRVTQCTAHKRGVANAVTVGQNNSFLENKVVINFDIRHGHSSYYSINGGKVDLTNQLPARASPFLFMTEATSMPHHATRWCGIRTLPIGSAKLNTW